MDCVSKKASSQPLDETAVPDKDTSLNESDCLDDKKLVDKNVAHNSSDHIPDDITVTAAEESQSFKTSKFTRTISPPSLGTLRSCFSWSGSLGDFSRTPSPSAGTALQQFHREGESLTSMPEKKEMTDGSRVKSDESGDETHPSHEVAWSSQSQESVELSPLNLSVPELSQRCSKDSDSEVTHIVKPLFSNSHVKEDRVFIIQLRKICLRYGNNWLINFSFYTLLCRKFTFYSLEGLIYIFYILKSCTFNLTVYPESLCVPLIMFY